MKENQSQEHLMVARARLGDEQAFADLVRRYTVRLLWFVQKFKLTQSTAEDVVQDTWLTAWTKLGRLRDVTLFRAWLYGIARHKALQHIQKERDVPMPALDPAAESPEDTYFDRYLPYLNKALDRVSLAHREALALRFLEGLSYEELAVATNTNVGTVKSRLHHAKLALRRELEVIVHD